jgi:hypothetical protein
MPVSFNKAGVKVCAGLQAFTFLFQAQATGRGNWRLHATFKAFLLS